MTDCEQHPTISSLRRTDGTFLLGNVPSNKLPSHRPELVGKQYGWVRIISPEMRHREKLDKKGHRAGWREVEVLCTGCGTQKWVSWYNLRSGRTNGCQKCSQPREYPAWLHKRVSAMRQRCENRKDAGYHRYGGRGIRFEFQSVAEGCRWITENLGLDKAREFDRIDNDGPYGPGNLRYATRSENSKNKRKSKLTEADYAWSETASPYHPLTTRRYLRAGKTRDEVICLAKQAVQEKRKGWTAISARLDELGFTIS